MAAISETLRQARLRSGVDLDRLAAKTKINPRYLEAIEKGDFDKLPSGIFARMFIKQYADAVGLDGASFAEEFQRSSQFGAYAPPSLGTVVESRSNFQPTVQSMSGDRGRDDRLASMLSSLIWVVAAILVCAGAYYALAHLPKHAVATSATAAAPAPPASAAPAPSKPVAEPAHEAPAVVAPPTAPSTATTSPAPAATTPSSDPIQLTLNATDPVWVTAIADGKTVISQVLQPGTSKSVSAAKGARLTLGNAGGVDITFNGKKLEPFGPKGQVRTIDFTSWGAQVVPKAPPAANAALPDPLR